MELKHQELRKRLDILGYEFPLPSGAISLVSSLLEDLLKTTESLKVAKHEIGLLLEVNKVTDAFLSWHTIYFIQRYFKEKACWELDTEPFRCDNSKLLADNNRLHIELLQERERFELELADLRNRLRSKKTEHKLLREKYSELVTRSKDLALKKDATAMGQCSVNMRLWYF
jgi:centrosomal protein CEP135